MGTFAEHVSAGMGALRSFAGETVLLSRGVATGSCLAVQTRRPYEATDEGGLVTVILSEDFLVAAAEYLIGGVAVVPAAGDRLEVSSGDVFEVMPLAGGNHFDWRDAAKTEMRVHTKRVTAG